MAISPSLLDSGTLGESRHSAEIDGLVVTETVHLPGSAIEPHAHARAGFNLVLEGGYGEGTQGAFHLHPPATLIAKPAGEPHSNRFDERGARCLLIEFEAAWSDRLQEMGDPLREPAAWQAGTVAVSGVRAIRSLRGEGPPPVAIEEAAHDLLRHTADQRRLTVERTKPAWLRAVRDRIHATAPERVRLDDLAAEARVHPGHLSEVFRRVFGLTISCYVERLRLERAVRDLAGTDGPVGRIAVRSGFYDHAHLTRAFRRATGTTPSAFRRAIRA
jgi:AraC family transcriptional regulator